MKMKHTLAFLAAVAFTAVAYAQNSGPVWVNNWGPPESPIYYLVDTAVLPSGLLTLSANGTEFAKDIAVMDGFFDEGFKFTGAADGSTAAFKAVVTAPGGEKGEATWNQAVGTTPALPAAPVPTDMLFPKIVVTAGGPIPSVPEPSMIALALLGGAALLLRRRN